MAAHRDPLLESGRTIERNATTEAREQGLESQKVRKQKDLERTRVLRLISTSDVLQRFKNYAEANIAEILKKISHSADRDVGETLEILAASYACHQSYLDYMEVLENEGRNAADRMKNYEV